MAINRFQQPVESEYISLYVPIPFQELVTLGKYYGELRKAAEKEMADYSKSVGEFQSLLEKDVENYRKIALNENVRRYFDEAAANPSVMKSAAWRSGMLSALNTVNYSDLSMLKKSAEQADEYEKLRQTLAALGLLPPGWELDYYTSYDTIELRRIFDKTPLPYKSVEDVAYSMVKDLNDTWLEKHSGYNWYGVDEKTVLEQIDEKKSELLSNPAVANHLRILTEQLKDPEAALRTVMDWAITGAMRRVAKKPEIDQYDLARTKFGYDRYIASMKNGVNGNVLGIESTLTGDWRNNLLSIANRYYREDETYKLLVDELDSQVNEKELLLIDKYRKEIPGYDDAFTKLYEAYSEKNPDASDDEITQSVNAYIMQNTDLVKGKYAEMYNNEIIGLYGENDIRKTQEAFGRAIYEDMTNFVLENQRDGKDITSNKGLFQVLKSATDTGLFSGNIQWFDENVYQHMWGNALESVMVRFSDLDSQTVQEELYGGKIPSDELGFKESDRSQFTSPKQFILSQDNPYIGQKLKEAGLTVDDVMGFQLNRSGTRAGGDTSRFSLEERAVNGDFGTFKTEKVIGYIDTPDARNYLVKVNIPIGDNSSFKKNMTSYWAFDDLYGAASDANYEVSMTNDGTPYITLTLVKSVKNRDRDKTTRNRKYQKEYGTADTKEVQIRQDDMLLLLNGYGITDGF